MLSSVLLIEEDPGTANVEPGLPHTQGSPPPRSRRLAAMEEPLSGLRVKGESTMMEIECTLRIMS